MKQRTAILAGLLLAVLAYAASAAPDVQDTILVAAPEAASEGIASVPVPREAGGDVKDTIERPPFWAAFVASFFIILCSEIGDKTFFIAAIMSMKHSHVTVWLGAVAALWGMTVLSVVMGFALPNLLPRKYTHYASLALFLFFGVQLLREAMSMTGDEESEELQEVEAELSKKDDPALPNTNSKGGVGERRNSGDLEAISPDTPPQSNSSRGFTAENTLPNGGSSKDLLPSKRNNTHTVVKQVAFAAVFWQACTLTFVAEWGDRSQIATIALAAAKDPWGVCLGGCIGHAICTGVAVIGGKMLASSISERAVHYAGGILFLIFAVVGLFFDI
eukprot:GDKI01024060.1.p1 GENE.GDKI01024060.1~~GDKI01024060.1.p1  ORF type:complete len:332 (-),score=101.34 GDKI01024060.1:66-1061(-)